MIALNEWMKAPNIRYALPPSMCASAARLVLVDTRVASGLPSEAGRLGDAAEACEPLDR